MDNYGDQSIFDQVVIIFILVFTCCQQTLRIKKGVRFWEV